MNTKDAAYHTVHDYEGGSESLGPRVGISAAVLRNKVNPHNETHRLALDEAVRISVVTGDSRMLDAFAAELGRVTVEIPTAGTSDMDVLSDTCSLVTQVGQYMQTIHTALSDGKVDGKEIKAIRQQAIEAMSKVATLVACLEGMAE
jgi:hypothetical protein